MTMLSMRRAILLGLPLLAAAAACKPQPKAVLNVVDAHATLSAVPDRPIGVFLTVRGGPEAVRLLAVSSPMAGRVEIHDTVMDNGMMAMKPVTAVDIPARTQVAFKHGGKHIMVWGVNPKAVEQKVLPMTFIFSNNDRILADVRLDPPLAGGEPAAAGGMRGMDHQAMSADDHAKMMKGEAGNR